LIERPGHAVCYRAKPDILPGRRFWFFLSLPYITFLMEKTIHQGRNVKRFREMLGLKQEALAMELGDDWNQRKISLLEQKETIEPAVLQQVAAGRTENTGGSDTEFG
jgi:hypothetical protein